ncbi:MAG: MSMEG_0569 family flavin-dependent oxidoreductase [Actinomycetota bacterium]|nr:MSMEG_0569 family flavin-dependent oxidoreductase [Actinomycetota bacterium]
MIPDGSLDGLETGAVVVGGGQAGLAASYHLARLGVDHVVVERSEVAWEWKHRRWDSFCLVTPNWQCQLPGFPYGGDDPDGFMVRDDIVRYLEAYVEWSEPPLVTGVEVIGVRQGLAGDFAVTTSAGTILARHVVVCTGPYQEPTVPPLAEALPAELTQIHSSAYRRPSQLPDGDVVVVGTGQSGCQIAEDLHRAGRTVHLATGTAPRVARFYRGRDVVAWLDDMGYYTKTVDEHPLGTDVRSNVNHYVTGRDGGHDIDLRAFAREGMELYGRLLGRSGSALTFADDLSANLDHADAVSEGIKDAIDAHIVAAGIVARSEERYRPVWTPPPGERTIDLATTPIGSVVWCTGFRPDHGWLAAPVFDAAGRPLHQRGVTPTPGVYFLGLPWLLTWGSARFSGVGADAEHVAAVIADRLGGRHPPRDRTPARAAR